MQPLERRAFPMLRSKASDVTGSEKRWRGHDREDEGKVMGTEHRTGTYIKPDLHQTLLDAGGVDNDQRRVPENKHAALGSAGSYCRCQ